MCTLILAIDVVAPGTVLLGANRDENPARPSDAPGPLSDTPPVAGGRDRVAGGTWLAIHGREAAIAMLNRRGSPLSPTRSRGLLALDVARDPRPEVPFERLVRERYDPFSLVVARAERTIVISWDGSHARMVEVGAGWHVLTHAELDDINEPRAAWLRASLAALGPLTRDQAEREVKSRLARHDAPAVCLHDGPMATVSSGLVWLAEGEARYAHAEGRPCTASWTDYSALLRAAESA
jgi:uncharacterized protein with NRDE domain